MIEEIRENSILGGGNKRNLIGLSTDTKPTIYDGGELEAGSTFTEVNTGYEYVYNGGSWWKKKSSSGSSGGSGITDLSSFTTDELTQGATNLYLTNDEKTNYDNVIKEVTNARNSKSDLNTRLTGIETNVTNNASNITSNSLKIGDLTGNGITEANLATAIKNDRTSLSQMTQQQTTNTANIANKVDKITGKGLSTNDYDNAEKVKVSLIANKADTSYVNTQIQNMSSQVQGFYATVSALATAFSSGNSNNYVVTADNYIYRWNGSAWTSTGYLFNSATIADGTVTTEKTNFPYCKNYKNLGYETSYNTQNISNSGATNSCRFSTSYKTYTAGIYFIYLDFNLNITNLNEAYMIPTILRSSGGNLSANISDTNNKVPIYSKLTSTNNVVAYGVVTLPADITCAIGLTLSLMDTTITNTLMLTANKVYAIKISDISEVTDILKTSLDTYTFAQYIPVLEFPSDFMSKTEVESLISSSGITPDYSIFDQAYIKNRGLFANSDHANSSGIVAKYTGVDMGANVTSIKCKSKFNGTSNIALVAQSNGLSKVSDITTSAIHITFQPTICRVQYFQNSGGVVDITSFSYSGIDTTGSTEYSMGWSLNSATNTITVYLPDGTTQTVTNSIFSQVNGRYVIWEHYFTTTDSTWGSNTFTQFSATATGVVDLIDDFNRFDGAIGIAPTGHVYHQFRNVV